MTRNTVVIEQKLNRVAPGNFIVTMTVTDNDEVWSKEYTYFRTNKAFPSYKSLISVLREFEEVDVEFKTDNRYMVSEINGESDSRGNLAEMLSELLFENNITIKAV